TASGGIGYSGPGSQRFLTQNFSQSVATQSSSYSLGLNWELSGQTLSARPLQRAQERATDADIVGAAQALSSAVTQQYLTALQALRARERAAAWGVRSATSSYGPSVSLSASWSGFTQRFTDINPIITGQQLQYGSLLQDCQDENQIRTNAGLATRSCTTYQWGASQEQALRDQNSQYPFNFT